jgi:hypothetical protein
MECTLFAAEPLLVNRAISMSMPKAGSGFVRGQLSLRAKPPLRPAGDRIVILEDTDGDGKADKRPFSIRPGSTPRGDRCARQSRAGSRCLIFSVHHTDGDGKATKEVIFSGISGSARSAPTPSFLVLMEKFIWLRQQGR